MIEWGSTGHICIRGSEGIIKMTFLTDWVKYEKYVPTDLCNVLAGRVAFVIFCRPPHKLIALVYHTMTLKCSLSKEVNKFP